MATMTLLEIVQDILDDMESDNVNSISDTVESLRVAGIVKTTFYELIARRDWPHLNQLFAMDSVSDTAKPNYLKLPSGTQELEFLKYNCRKSTDTRDKYQKIEYMYPDNFLHRQNQLNDSLSNVSQVTDTSGVVFSIYNDRAPTYWTSFDDEYIVFDAYDSAVDTTVQGSKTQCRGIIEPSWSAVDTFVPDLPPDSFSLLLEEAKSAAFYSIKQVPNEKAEQRSKRQQRRLARKSFRAKGGIRWPDYGRKKNSQAWDRNPYLDKT